MNSQKPELKLYRDSGALDIVSIFSTIQGEGPFVGHPAVFVRLAGCNLDCTLCDTDYTTGRSTYNVQQIVDEIINITSVENLVVITGGEPFRQNIAPLIKMLIRASYKVQIETNGTLYVPGPWNDHKVTIVCSPKSNTINKKLVPYISAYKYVLRAGDINPNDGLPYCGLRSTNGKFLLARPASTKPVYIQPVDEKEEWRNKRNFETCIDISRKFGYILGIQLHKQAGLA